MPQWPLGCPCPTRIVTSAAHNPLVRSDALAVPGILGADHLGTVRPL